MSLVRRMRGAFGLAAIWGGAFAVTAVVVTATVVFAGPFRSFFEHPINLGMLLRMLGDVALRWSMIGGVTGLAFSGTIMLFERKRILGTLSPWRFTLWGFSAGAFVSIIATAAALTVGRRSAITNWTTGLIFAAVSGAIGATVAALSLRAARVSSPAEEGGQEPVSVT